MERVLVLIKETEEERQSTQCIQSSQVNSSQGTVDVKVEPGTAVPAPTVTGRMMGPPQKKRKPLIDRMQGGVYALTVLAESLKKEV